MQIGSAFIQAGNDFVRTQSGIMQIIALAFIGICAVFDMKKKEIPLILAITGILAALGINLYQIGNGTQSLLEMAFSLLPGVFLLLISFLTREKVGYGDGLLLLAAGLFIGFYQCLLALCFSLIFSSVFGVLLLLVRKADRSSEIPFVPFLVIGMGVGFFV